MDFLLFSQTNGVAAFLTLLVLLYSILLIARTLLKSFSEKRSAPEVGGAWPVLGHLHLLGGPEPLHRVLGKMADKSGPIFTIRMGIYRALVVSNWEIAKECLTTKDRVFANRPKTLASELLAYNFSMIGFSPYGPYWRQARKIATNELLSNHRLEKVKHVRESEVRTFIKELYELWVESRSSRSNWVLMDMKRWFGDVNLNVILRIIVGKRCNSQECEEWTEELTKFFEMTGKFVLSDAVPFLRWLDLGGDEKSMKKTAKKLDIIVQGWLEEKKKKKRDSGQTKGEEDFMDVMLSVLDDLDQFHDRDADTINKATCLALILAATTTTRATLTWVLALLVNHRDVLKKAQNELDIQIGRGRLVNDSDLKNLVYLQAILNEAMRLYPASPLTLPHESTEDCTVNGYQVPAGTRLLVNIWKIQRDPHIWSEPSKFQPERFLTTHKDIDVRGQNFEFIPFGSGRRMCPGVSFALQVIQLILASLLHSFDFATLSDEPVDMEEGIGLTMVKKTSLNVLISPRLSVGLYA